MRISHALIVESSSHIFRVIELKECKRSYNAINTCMKYDQNKNKKVEKGDETIATKH